jgi:hypothetical protein
MKNIDYDSKSYKIMCIMDIMLDINPNYRNDFDDSEDMYINLSNLITKFEEQDNGDGAWYDSLVDFLQKEYKEIK